MGKIKSVVAEIEGPSKKDMLRAMGCMLCFNFNGAQRILRGSVSIQARDAADNTVLGVSGGSNARIYIYPHDVAEDAPPAPPAPTGPTQAERDAAAAAIDALASGATVLQDKVKVGAPLKIRQPATP